MDVKFQDPQARLDYHFEWQCWLAPGDYLTESEWLVPDGLTATEPTLFVGQERDLAGDYQPVQRTTVFLTGGIAGEVYTVTNRITTARGRQEDRSFELRIKEQ